MVHKNLGIDMGNEYNTISFARELWLVNWDAKEIELKWENKSRMENATVGHRIR